MLPARSLIKTFNRLKVIVCALSMLILVASVRAEPPRELPGIIFSVKPRLCVLSERERHCSDKLELKWQAPTRQSLCLHRSDQASAIKCWTRKFSGIHEVEISTADDIEFQLVAVTDQAPLVTQTFEVVKSDVKYRRRRRNAWSFF
ncbi:MAG: peptidoglycan-binding LysM [Alteromonadaceae bacterium]|nr:MAG: peptidoglycan-binding LysM [Alteromonadaceae bacterium]